MIKLMLAEVVQALGARVRGEVRTASIGRVSTDSRTVGAGDLFFAISGPRFDGHAFVPAALKGGAVAAVIQAARGDEVAALAAAELGQPVAPGRLLEVDDTVRALGRLAAYHRRLVSASIVAVVGSNGKTTTKAMIQHVLSGRMRGQCSPKSFNNQIGVPLTLLSADAADEFMVVEIGTNASGEVATLADMARPDMAVITCISEEHLEGLGDLAGVAAEECSILDKLDARGFAAVNIDQAIVRNHLPRDGVTVVTFGRSPEADLRLTELHYQSPWMYFTVNGRFAYRLPVAGAHNALNAAGAIAIARRLGLDHEQIAERLESFSTPPMRNQVITLGGVTILNDAYNANPGSAVAALDVLETLPCRGRRIAVFGEMRELGRHAPALHRRVARRLLDGRVDRILLVGAANELMAAELAEKSLFGPAVTHCSDVDACLALLAHELRDGDVVLLKASRAVGLDRVVEPLRQALGQAAPAT